MNVEEFRWYCLSKPGTTEEFPFDETTLVFKVMGKVYALTGLDNVEFKVNLKCDPNRSLELRDAYEGIQPGYHMSKKHWNTVHVENGIPRDLFIELIDHSYDLVVSGLKKSLRLELEELIRNSDAN